MKTKGEKQQKKASMCERQAKACTLPPSVCRCSALADVTASHLIQKGPLDKRDRVCILCDILALIKVMSPTFPSNFDRICENEDNVLGGGGKHPYSLHWCSRY